MIWRVFWKYLTFSTILWWIWFGFNRKVQSINPKSKRTIFYIEIFDETIWFVALFYMSETSEKNTYANWLFRRTHVFYLDVKEKIKVFKIVTWTLEVLDSNFGYQTETVNPKFSFSKPNRKYKILFFPIHFRILVVQFHEKKN